MGENEREMQLNKAGVKIGKQRERERLMSKEKIEERERERN